MEHSITVRQTSGYQSIPVMALPRGEPAQLTLLRLSWGTDICRIEYLIHLVDTGRIRQD